jgi:hypothetical protein
MSGYKIEITIAESKPEIIREVLVDKNITLHKLHQIIQSIFNWENYHLYRFDINNEYYEQKLPDLPNDSRDTKKYKLGNIAKVNDVFEYVYDFGDDWLHKIKITEETNDEVKTPVCLQAEGIAPREDCGGIYGFMDLLEIANKKKMNADEKELFEAYDLGNLEEPNLDKINEKLKKQTARKQARNWVWVKED